MALRGERAIEPESEWGGLRPGAARLGDSRGDAAANTRPTAERLFRQYGYQKTTVADIAAELDMSPANVYRFFASKAAITEAVARQGDDRGRRAGAAGDAGAGPSACERLRRLVAAMQRAVTQRCLQDNRMHAMVHAAIEQNWNVIQAHKENIRRVIAGVVADGVAAGEFDVEDVDLAAHCFQAATISYSHPMIIEHRLRSGDDIDATLAPMVAFALRGLGAREPG